MKKVMLFRLYFGKMLISSKLKKKLVNFRLSYVKFIHLQRAYDIKLEKHLRYIYNDLKIRSGNGIGSCPQKL